MINIAIIDDEKVCSDNLISLLERYSKEGDIVFSTHVFFSAEAFLENYKPIYDIVFMDVDLPGDNGIKATKKLRTFDEKVILFFQRILLNLLLRDIR